MRLRHAARKGPAGVVGFMGGDPPCAQEEDWRARESAILALGAISEGCAAGLLGHLAEMVRALQNSWQSDTDQHSLRRQSWRHDVPGPSLWRFQGAGGR